jgi:endonuclease YncB( thermonuclease family)
MLHARARASLWPIIGISLVCAFLPGSAAARERLPGPVAARVERVIDGDTFAVRARIWPGLEVQVSVRPRGVDAPELFHPRCAQEREHAKAARAFLDNLIGGKTVILSEIENDKFAGRIDASVTLSDARDLSQVLIKSGLAQPYDGGAHPSFCPT